MTDMTCLNLSHLLIKKQKTKNEPGLNNDKIVFIWDHS